MNPAEKLYKTEGKTKKIIVESCQQCPENESCAKFNQLKSPERFMLLCGVGIADVFHEDCPLEDN